MQAEDLIFTLVKKRGGKWHIRHSYASCENTPHLGSEKREMGPFLVDLDQSLADDDLVMLRLHENVTVTDLHDAICMRCKRNFLGGIRAKMQIERHKERIRKRLAATG